MNTTAATTPQTIAVLGYAAWVTYAVAVLLFIGGWTTSHDGVRDAGLALGLLGLALDMRHHTAVAITRMVHSVSLWQDYDGPDPTHRRDRPPTPDVAGTLGP